MKLKNQFKNGMPQCQNKHDAGHVARVIKDKIYCAKCYRKIVANGGGTKHLSEDLQSISGGIDG